MKNYSIEVAARKPGDSGQIFAQLSIYLKTSERFYKLYVKID